MNDIEKVGWQIRRFRSERGLKQEELAEKSGVGRPHLSRIENGNANLSVQILINISKALKIQPSYLLRRALDE